jgi:outer membrane protein OmpA-like peptidoglycan-associated protein
MKGLTMNPSLPRFAARAVGALVVAALASAGLAGCTASGSDELVFVIGAVEGAPYIGPSLIEPHLAGIDATGDRVTVIVADGDPFAAGDWTVPSLEGTADDAETLADLHADVLSVAATALARTPETDLTAAIRLADSVFTEDPGSKRLVVLSPMLQTVGALDLTRGRFDLTVDELLDYAGTNEGYPDLSQVVVEVPRLGLVEAPQPTLDAPALDHLTALWTEYFARSNAASSDFSTDSLTHRPQEGDLPGVTAVTIDRAIAPCAIALDDAAIRFEVGTAVFLDPAQATASIERAAAALADCEGDYLVEGSASSEGDAAANEALSGDRAGSVVSILEPTLPSAPSIDTIAWGEGWPCRIPDLDAAGELIPAAAAANRVVVISRGVAPGTC